jgi:hypothetical protein
MTEQEWEGDQQHAQGMLWSLRELGKVQRTKAGRRKLRLFACGCCRLLVWELLTDARSREAVNVAEQFAEGLASQEQLSKAHQSAVALMYAGQLPTEVGEQGLTAASLAANAADPKPFSAAFPMTALPIPLTGYRAEDRERDVLIRRLLRCVFGNPFRPVSLDPGWLVWNAGTVPSMAQRIYDERAFDRLPILADALEEAGCDNADILNHCRQPGVHARGCWVVDSLLAKS